MLTNFLQFPFKNEFVNINLCMKNNLKLSHCIQAVETFHNAFGISNESGLAFGWIIWTSQTLMIIVFGSLSFFVLPLVNRKN